jgi:hypothetical protein
MSRYFIAFVDQREPELVKRIKWCIFDEVHNINDAELGAVWERLLQLTSCPFLALSATVGEPEKFRDWLSRARKAPVELIVHSERYNDLRTSVVGSNGQLINLHPLSLTTSKQLRLNGCPPMVDFEAKDALQLYDSMFNVNSKGMEDLDPQKVFLEPCITRTARKKWARNLTARLVEWSAQSDDAEKVLKSSMQYWSPRAYSCRLTATKRPKEPIL